MQEINTPFLKFTRAFLEWSKDKNAVTISISTFFDFVKDVGLMDVEKVEKYIENRSGEIKSGDFVRISNANCLYTTYTAWVTEHISDKSQIARFQFDSKEVSEVNCYEVIAVENEIAFIENNTDFKCYLINTAGLEKWRASDE